VGDDDIAAPEAGGQQQADHETKPWRHRKRRTSADIERDRLVEEVMRESKRRLIFRFFFLLTKRKRNECVLTVTSGCLRRARRRGIGG
jgi:hypothetical protein